MTNDKNDVLYQCGGDMTKTETNLLIEVFTHGHVTVVSPMLSLTHRKGVARKKLVAQGFLNVTRTWIDDNGMFHSTVRLSNKGNGYMTNLWISYRVALELKYFADNYMIEWSKNGEKERDGTR